MRPGTSIAAFVSQRRAGLARAFALALCLPLLAGAQGSTDTSTLRVQILNGRTGRPVTNEHLSLRRADGRALDGSRNVPSETTDGEGYASIPNIETSVSEVVVHVDWHRPCAKNDKHSFALAKIRISGVVSENSCRPRITMFPQPGTLIFYVRDETFIEKMRH